MLNLTSPHGAQKNIPPSKHDILNVCDNHSSTYRSAAAFGAEFGRRLIKQATKKQSSRPVKAVTKQLRRRLKLKDDKPKKERRVDAFHWRHSTRPPTQRRGWLLTVLL